MNPKSILYLWTIPVLFTMCHPRGTQSSARPIPVDVLVIDTVTSFITHTYVGTACDAEVIGLSFGQMGTIAHVYVHNGEHVSKGQAIMALDATKELSALATARAKWQQAQDAYDRVKMVYDDGGVTQVKMREVQTQLHEAEQLVTILQKQVDERTLRAPIAGVMGDITNYVGQNILPDVRVATLHNRTLKSVVYSVPEQDIVKIRVGDRVSVRIPALGDTWWQGRVQERSLSANAIAHSYQVKCLLQGDTQSILPGMSCRVQCEHDQVCGYIVPAHCVQAIVDGRCVWLCRDGMAHRVRIVTTAFGRHGVLVTDGLNKGDTVIVQGYQKLYEGEPVTIHAQ